MTSHLGLLVLFAAFVSVVFAALTRDEPNEQWRYGVRLFGAMVGIALALAWVLYFFPL